jgi:hypothetical protein
MHIVLGWWCAMLAGLLLCLVITMLAGCSPRVVTQEVPVVVEHTTTQHHTDIVRDTLLMRDSIYHFVQGDTCIIERWHHSIAVNKMIVTDTVRDTVPVVTEVKVTEFREVNRVRWWQSGLCPLAGEALRMARSSSFFHKL